MKRFIIVTFDVEGIHHFTEVEKLLKYEQDQISDVTFLKYPHRHLFKIKVTIPVMHENRALEFFQVKRELQQLVKDYYPQRYGCVYFADRSCEAIAADIGGIVFKKYKVFPEYVEVYEDNENGGLVVWRNF